MPVEVILPKVDMDMTHGTLAVWHVAPGDQVAKGAALFDIETDKAAMEVESPASGRLHAVTAKPGDKVAVGTVVALIYTEGESVAEVPAPPVAEVPSSGPQPIEVILPKVDMDMSHGTLAAWHVAEGGSVTKGTALFDIETDKAAMEVEAPATGTLHHLMAAPGDKVPVGDVVAHIYPPGMAVGPRPARAAIATPAELPPTPSDPAPMPAPMMAAKSIAHSGIDGNVRATPAARASARQAGLTLAEVKGTGPMGRIQSDDVTMHLEGQSGEICGSTPVGPAIWSPQPGPLHVSHRMGAGIPLVLLHGFTADSQSWAPFEKALGPDQPLIRIDLPGHGRSPRRRLRSFADLARMLVEAFDEATRTHDRVHLLGHSLGGALALAIADIRARNVASLTLIAPAGLGPEIDGASLLGITRASRAESLAPWLRRLTATPEGISDDYARAAMKQRNDPALRATQADMAEILFPDGVQPFDLRPALARVECPTALIWGRKDHILPYRHSLAAGGDFAIHLLSDAGHVPQIECPDRVARIVERHQSGALAGKR
ncbi:acetoin dehydrogenase dihydrolipoyllysine-residue acetyltransferase subunit [Gemmobacter lanyuensis]|uniref:Acetoin dehydrogenase dihydrolipoyllysine-residue acetyltransferase subunit n=1 Tax=Gemmobacter lanyuensis TaxID=1054497 RepID=A0A918J028_9RHOB|nr:acetoin dehydrogenase dihydrolipoyllysine-residue acetyltransferase subunit [Gemmobacter lanyuensis]GGW39782.1 acetoin dehydrogenase dihydrolipoyllysine-residue acetyltransferase subunit [Gemmobacter lanyuensis]